MDTGDDTDAAECVGESSGPHISKVAAVQRAASLWSSLPAAVHKALGSVGADTLQSFFALESKVFWQTLRRFPCLEKYSITLCRLRVLGNPSSDQKQADLSEKAMVTGLLKLEAMPASR